MNTEIYYFSGTGNSLAAARDIAEKTKGTLISIPSVMDRLHINIKADSIGIVFPCYMAQLYGIPLMVEGFVKKLENIDTKYIFAVCTCGGRESFNALPTLKNLGRLIKSKGGKLSAEFSINLPMNNLNYYFFQDQNHETMFKKCRKKIEVIYQCIAGKKRNNYRILKSLFYFLITPMNFLLQNFYIIHLKEKSKEPGDTKLTYHELIPLTDKSISADDKCNGCSVCAKVCPAGNIKMTGNKPVWQHHCEMCMACVEWCPVKAIRHWNIEEGKSYHHPDIKISDMYRHH
ncbi:MAG: EFR1 family ferrodoxin [Spirochaetales bacterium]|nr:EFR1 family ferrodoxin [Spirochaetales bacterium]